MLTLGEKIRTAREKVDMSPQELAKAIGISQPYMSQIENNARTPGRDKLIKIAKVLSVPMDYLTSSDIVIYNGDSVILMDAKDSSQSEAVKKTLIYYAELDKAEKAGLSEQQIKDAIEFAIKMKTQA